jgi:hypothetical protein
MPSTVSKLVSYTNGWDDPKFFPVGGWLAYTHGSTDVTMYLDLNWNTHFACFSNSDLSFAQAAGISIVPYSGDLFTGGTGGLIPGNGNVLPTCCVGLLTQDEPSAESQMSGPISGVPISGCGSTTSPCLTNALQDSCFWWTNFLENALIDNKIGGVLVTPHQFIKEYPTPNSTTRNACDLSGLDAYLVHAARRPEFWGQTISNLIDGTAPYIGSDMARGTHQGLWLDYTRIGFPATAGNFPTRPLMVALATGNVKGNVPYEQGNHELNWEVWSVIIHGGRGLFFFDVDDTVSWYGTASPQEGNYAFSQMKCSKLQHLRERSAVPESAI